MIWTNEQTATEAGANAVRTLAIPPVTEDALAGICDATVAVGTVIEAGGATRATVLAAVAQAVATSPADVRDIAGDFNHAVSTMPATSRAMAYAMLAAWWDGACDAARELAEPAPVEVAEPAPVDPPVEVAPPAPVDPPVEVAPPALDPPVEGAPPVEVAEPAPVDAPDVFDTPDPGDMAAAGAMLASMAEPEAEPAPTTKAVRTGDQLDDAREAALREAPQAVEDVYRSCVWLSVVFARLGTTRAADVTATTAEGRDVTSKVRSSKVILSDCPEWAAIQAADTRFRLQIREVAVPTSLKGIYPIPVAAMEAVEEMIGTYESERKALVGKLVDAYDQAVLRDRDVLADGLWDPADYPERGYVRRAYRMSGTWKDLSASSRISTAMAARNAEASREEQRAAFAEVRAGLRVMLAGMLDELLGALKPDEAGNLRRFNDTRVTKIRAWLDGLPVRDVTDDAELRALADRIRGTLDSIPQIDDLRKDEGFRAATAAKLDEVREGLRTLGVGDAPVRKMRGAARKGKASKPQDGDDA